MKMIRNFLLLSLIFFQSIAMGYTTPTKITLQGTISSQQLGLLDGYFDVEVKIAENSDEIAVWSDTFETVGFSNGSFSLILEDVTEEDIGDLSDPVFMVKIDDIDSDNWIKFPIPANAYAIQALAAETVISVNASVVSGTFTSTVNITNDLIVGSDVLYVDADNERVGINTTNPSYNLHVVGDINASGYLLDGQSIEEVLSWSKKGDDLYYTDGNVGIGTSSPNYLLDVAGTVNAQAYYIQGSEIADYLRNTSVWYSNEDGDIYYGSDTADVDEYLVGIGVDSPRERLDVDGSIRLGLSVQPAPYAGTIQYDSDSEDLQGYDGSEWVSLFGLEGSASGNQVAFWSGTNELDGSDNLTWDDSDLLLGIGTSNPTARLDIVAPDDSFPLMHVRDSEGATVFYADENGVGIGTDSPQFALDVNGIVDASEFLINGEDISFALADGSYWILGNNRNVYYDQGYVGIGTNSPNNLLELSSVATSAITFDIDGTDYFTLGISALAPDSFVLSEGGDLDDPVFTFSADKIGIGTLYPSSNLHVAGDAGMIVTGEYGASTSLDLTTAASRMYFIPGKAVFRAGYLRDDLIETSELGDYSVGLGDSPRASGLGAAALGGLQPIASGDYATVLGGRNNTAAGNYSVAAGYYANAAHTGSFVWADYDPTNDSFSSTASKQFIIRAANGVGIGTNDTGDAGLTIAVEDTSDYILIGKDANGDAQFVVNPSGNVGIGTEDPGTAALSVMDGYVGVGTTSPSASFHIVNSESDSLLFLALTEENSPTAAFMINSNGQVGVNVSVNRVFDSNDSMVVNGTIIANGFILDTEEGTIVLTPSQSSPWGEPTIENNFSTFYNLGPVGIGTSTPNSLLELSNGNVSGNLPVITFDIGGTDLFSVGPTLNNAEDDYYFTIQPGGTLSDSPPFTISSQSVGIGIGLDTPSANLHISGNASIVGSLSVGTTNIISAFPLNVAGIVNAENFYKNGVEFIPTDSPWSTNGANIYYTSGNVGIGTTTPGEQLEVAGTISTNYLAINNLFSLSSNLKTTEIEFIDQTNSEDIGVLAVNDGELEYTDPLGNTTLLNGSLTKGSGTEGNIGYFIDDTTIGETDLTWSGTDPILALSGNMLVNRSVETTGFTISSNISLGGLYPFSISSNISHTSLQETVKDYKAQYINVDILDDWGNPDDPVEVVGMDISLATDTDAVLFGNASAVGLRVDVSSANAVDGDVYSAVFLGGNVGIGLSNPSTTLEVAGTVSANSFNLSNLLTVSELNVGTDTLVARTDLVNAESVPRIGIGLSNPLDFDAELYVNGLVSANEVVINGGIESVTLNIASTSNSFFVIDEEGDIGIGTASPNSQIHIAKSLDETDSEPFISQLIDVTIDGAGVNQTFRLDKDITGLSILLDTEESSALNSNAYGINVDMSELNLETDSSATGLYVNVDGTSGTRYAGIFNGGYVGIGVTPSAELHVSGDILATNLYIDETIGGEEAIFGNLIVNDTATFNGSVTVNTLYVNGQLTADTLYIGNEFTAPEATVATLSANIASINTLVLRNLFVTDNLVGNGAAFSGPVGVGRSAPTSGLAVSGNSVIDSLQVNNAITLSSVTLNINNGDLYINPDSSYVGINTLTPTAQLHVNTAFSSTYLASDSSTWANARFQTLSNLSNSAAGILLLPDISSVSSNVGSGIVAVRQSSSDDISDLVFITDPESGSQAEVARLTSEGYFGIGTSSPTVPLYVNGDALIQDSLTVNGTLYASTLSTSASSLTITPNGTFIVDGNVSVNNDLIVNEGLYLISQDTPSAESAYGRLYVNDTDDDLYYLAPSSLSPVNLSSAFTGDAQRIPYFDDDGNLIDNADLFYDADSVMFKIGTQNALTSFQVVSSVNSTVSGDIALHKIQVELDDRAFASNAATIKGLDITFQSTDPGSQTNVGRLADGETAVGLLVDMRELRAKQFLNDNSSSGGIKHAAAFLGGNVGIGTESPEASLQIVSEVAGNTPLIVDSTGTSNAFVVDDTGFVGIGTAEPESSLTIVGTSDDSSASSLEVLNSSSEPLLTVRNDGLIGIGTDSPSAELDVLGTISANIAVAQSLTGATLNIGAGNFVVDASGNIGIGTIAPSSHLEFRKTFDEEPSADYTSHLIDLTIGDADQQGLRYYNNALTGLDITFQSNGGGQIGNGSSGTGKAVGVSVNMSNLILNSDGQATGIYVDVTGNTGTRYAAILMGGNVGIGTESPTAGLEVSGDIKASSLILSGSLEANSVTFNRVAVSGTATFNGAVSVNSLIADTVDVSKVVINGDLAVSTASFTTLNVTNFASIESLAVGTTDLSDYTFYVEGDTRLSGNVDIAGTLNVTTINSLSSEPVQIAASNGVSVSGDITASDDLIVSGLLYMAPLTPPTAADSNSGRLFVSGNGDLTYLPPSSTTYLNISDSLSGTATRVPFFNSDGILSDDALISYDESTQQLIIGSAGETTGLHITANIPATLNSNFDAQKIYVSLDDRALESEASNVFTGLDILMDGVESGVNGTFGRLAAGETAVGLKVDVTDIAARYSTTAGQQNDFTVSANKYAALFTGGYVGIGNTSPAAALHVTAEASGVPPLRVDTASDEYLLYVNGDGDVGMGTSDPDGRLTIAGETSDDTAQALRILDSSSSTILVARNDGNIGIGTDAPSSQLHVSGNAPLRIDTASDTNRLVVNSNGYLGLGTSSPEGLFHVVNDGSVDTLRIDADSDNTSSLVVDSSGLVGVGVADPSFQLHVDGVVMSGTLNATTGLSSLPSFIADNTTDARGFLAIQDSSHVFFGLKESASNSAVYDSVLHYGSGTEDLIFQRYNTAASHNEVMRLTDDGNVGIGITSPTAKLHVSGNIPLVAGNDTIPNALYVSSDGYVGINTDSPSTNLDVNGSLTAKTFTVDTGVVSVSTLNITGQLNLVKTVTTSATTYGQLIDLNLDSDIQNDVVGLDISLQSLARAQNPEHNYSLYDDGNGYGIKVDVSDLTIDNGFNNGNRYSGVFLGGYVGIGTATPEELLHVYADRDDETEDISLAKFSSAVDNTRIGDLRLVDYGLNTDSEAAFGFKISPGNPLREYYTLMFVSGTDEIGKVGIGTTDSDDVDKTLVVNGDTRLGVLRTSETVSGTGGYGNKLLFSGGPIVSSSYDGDNNDEIWMARYNAAAEESELRVSVGEDGTNTDKFLVGYTEDDTYNAVLDVRMNGKVGIGDTRDTLFEPLAPLHIKANKSGSGDVEDHVMIIENTGDSGADSLAIYHNTASSNIGTDSYFMSFWAASSALMGMISGNGNNDGVRYVSVGADYAEYLKKANPDESVKIGDIVGVVNGLISKDTSEAQQVMVQSSSASVAGNYPGEGSLDLYELIAFFGQVPVNIRGSVSLGDYIVPSGENDGTGVAVSPENIHNYPANLIVGRAWEASDETDLKLIKTAVGFNFSMPDLQHSLDELKTLQKSVETLESKQNSLHRDFEQEFDAQTQEINVLLEKLQAKI